MPLVAYVPDPRRYEDIFVVQTGHGPFIRYRGSLQNGSGFFPQVLKSLFAKIANFARPILEPHARAAFEAAKPHLKEAASGLVKEATSKATDLISRRLTTQEGRGRKRRKTARKAVKKPRYIPPKNMPDFI
jgi:hypothetical protein